MRDIQKISEKILSEYKKEFIYLNSKILSPCLKNNSLRGELLYQGGHYLDQYCGQSQILNNTEALFADNQSSYILMFFYFRDKHVFSSPDEDVNAQLNEYLEIMGKLVIREQRLAFKKPIYNVLQDLCFNTHICEARKTRAGLFFSTETTIGQLENFCLTKKVFLVNANLHAGDPL